MITNEMKKQIEVKVDLEFLIKPEELSILEQIISILKKYHLESQVSDARYYGPRKHLQCRGYINLYEADAIVCEMDGIPEGIYINYNKGNFCLTNPMH